MNYLIYGPDIFRAQQFITQQINSTNTEETKIEKIDGSIVDPVKLTQTLEPLQLFAQKKLIIIKNILSNKQKKTQDLIKEFIKNPNSDTSIIFHESSNIDKRSWLYKYFSKNKTNIHEFSELKKPQLIAWLKEYCASKEINIDHEAIFYLTDNYQNTFFIINEIQKLKHYTKNNITSKSIKEITPPNPSEIIFDLTDQIGLKQKTKAYNTALSLTKQGEDQFKILATLTTHIQNLMIIKDYLNKKFNQNQIKEKTNIHPYVIQKIYRQSNNFTLPELLKTHHLITQADINLKSGKTNFKTEIYNIIFT